jgi:hypothetical protein
MRSQHLAASHAPRGRNRKRPFEDVLEWSHKKYKEDTVTDRYSRPIDGYKARRGTDHLALVMEALD